MKDILDELQDMNMRIGSLEDDDFNSEWNGCQKRLTSIYEELQKGDGNEA